MISQFDDLPQPTHSDNEEEEDIQYSQGHQGIPPVGEDDEEGEVSGEEIGQPQEQHLPKPFLRKDHMFMGRGDKFKQKYKNQGFNHMNDDDDDYNDQEFEEGETNEKSLSNMPAILQQQKKFAHQPQQQNPHKKQKLHTNNGYTNKYAGDAPNKQFPSYRKEIPEEKKDNYKSANKGKSNSLVEDLTFEEAERLLEAWRESSFIQFNNWVQVSKSSLKQEFTAHQSGVDEKGEKSSQITGYSCNLTLKFYYNRHGSAHDYVAVGFGKRKQDAKKMALERLVVDLIQTGSIKLGLRDKKFTVEDSAPQVKENVYFQQVAKPKPRSDFEEKLQESNLKRARKTAKKLQDCLKKQNIAEAVNCLKEISKFKQLEWNEISFIWSYGVVKQNSVLLQQVLDVINKKTIGLEGALQPDQNGSKTGDDVIQSSKDFLNKYDEDKVKQKLFLHYGITRQKSTNIHDIYDSTAIEFAEKEILTSGLPPFNEEEFGRELIRDPFARDLQDILIPLTNAETVAAGSASPLRTVYEKAQKWPLRYIAHPLAADEKEDDLDGDEDLSIAKLHPKLKFLKDFDVNSSNYQKVSQAIFGNKSSMNALKRENAVPALLIDEMYETLIYSGDRQFSLEIAEKVYSQLTIETAGFVHESSADYYAHKQNMIMTESIDTLYETISSRNVVDYICNLNGKIEKIGTAHNYDVIALTPLEPEETIEQKLIKRCKFDVKETQHVIVEGDAVILTSFFRPSYDRPVLDVESSKLASFINTRSKTTKDNRDFIHNITEFGNIIEFALIATVREVTKDGKIKLFVAPSSEQSKSLVIDQARNWKITKVFSRTAHDRIHEALKELCFNQSAVHPFILHTLCTPVGESSKVIRRLASSDKYKATNTKTQLNAEQQLAVEKAALNRVTLIQGPPGSGKTTTGVEIVLEWLRSSNQPILVTGESQQTVNKIYQELIKANVKAVAIGPGFEDMLDALNSQLGMKGDPFISDQIWNAKMTRQQQQQQQPLVPIKPNSSNSNEQSSMKFLILKKMLREAQVVCCSCQSVMSDYLKGLHFTRVIIDQANTVPEHLALLPLHKLCNQLVLIGDHMQEPPTSMSLFAASKGSCMSLYEKFITQGFQPHLLKTQYKLAENQMAFSSKYFYNNLLESGNLDDFRQELRGFPWPNPAVKTCFIFARGQEQATQISDQLQNTKEVEVVTEVILQLLKAGYVRSHEIGVLTTFEEQKRRLRTEVNTQARKFPGMFGLSMDETTRVTKHTTILDIETLDKASTLEKDLIIFSPVRSNKHKAVGVLKDPRTLNQLLWSGKKGLIIIGDIETLASDIHWKEYVKWARSNNLVLCYCK